MSSLHIRVPTLLPLGWLKKNQLQGRDQGTTQFCSIYQLYYSRKISASYSIWKWVLTDPKFCPLETQFKYTQQAHCSTESLVVSSPGWLAIPWDGTCSVIGIYAVMSPLLYPRHYHFLKLQRCLGRNPVWESSEFGSEGGLRILQGIRCPVPDICDWWWETDHRWLPRTDWTDYYSSRLSSTNNTIYCSALGPPYSVLFPSPHHTVWLNTASTA